MAIIKLDYDGKTYELTYTRETVRAMERNGFNLTAFMNGEKPSIYGPQLFEGAFAAKHKKMTRKAISDIFDHLDGKSDLLVALIECYNDTLATLVDTAAVDDGKKVTWEKV